jgi:hypothetical protein
MLVVVVLPRTPECGTFKLRHLRFGGDINLEARGRKDLQ